MKLQALLSAAVAVVALAPLAKADTYIETESTRPLPMETREVRTTIESAPIVRETPVVVPAPAPTIITPPAETIVVKKHAHHLINLGVVKVF